MGPDDAMLDHTVVSPAYTLPPLQRRSSMQSADGVYQLPAVGHLSDPSSHPDFVVAA